LDSASPALDEARRPQRQGQAIGVELGCLGDLLRTKAPMSDGYTLSPQNERDVLSVDLELVANRQMVLPRLYQATRSSI
jgi:hypothetical protein